MPQELTLPNRSSIKGNVKKKSPPRDGDSGKYPYCKHSYRVEEPAGFVEEPAGRVEEPAGFVEEPDGRLEEPLG